MLTNNPYAQGGWHNPQNPHSINDQGWNSNASHPPTFGALPAFTSSPPTNLVFEFTDVLNCAVKGPGGKPYLVIATNQTSTTITKPNGEPVARVGWQTHPWVEVVNIINRQTTSLWLQLSSDLSYRTMTFGGRPYAWVPNGGSIVLSTTGPSPPEQLVRINRASNKVVMEITSQAIHAGLLEVSVVATVLFQSGRNLA